MSTIVPVALAGRAYDVVIGRGVLKDIGPRLRALTERAFAAVVIDETVNRLHGARLEKVLAGSGIACQPIVIPPGEAAKSFAGLESVCDAMLALELDRGDIVIAFGGGVVGDLTGLAAAIVKRGMGFIQIPTTLLAQVDSSVGGKTAIDTPRGKNLIGVFHQPRLVLADLALLDTLPERQMRSGFAEVLKYGLLGDAGFFDWLAANAEAVLARSGGALGEAVARSVAMKADIVAADEREGGARALLNLGHTFAHALEAELGYDDALSHGEAVAIGCAMAFRFSARLGISSKADAKRVAAVIAACGLPTTLADLKRRFSADALLARMLQDKKASAGRMTFILAHGIGRAFVYRDADAPTVRAFLIAEGAAP
ncbi:MAG TPA: 3-dehydroquinate synthase [Caulobacteraceae bacterium]|jgi:3-dehydroquinate synthase